MDDENEHEKRYEIWKRRRAEADVPADFADRVMASVQRTHVVGAWLWVQRMKRAFDRSKTLQTSVYLAALAFLILRVAALFAIFVPLG
jgi:hypothetical protein